MAITPWVPLDSQTRGLADFRAQLGTGGARPNLYECDIVFPGGVIDVAGDVRVADTRFMIKAAALPAANVGSIEVPYMGMQFKVAGDRTFDPWTITVINDTTFDIKGAFERWANFINAAGARSGLSNPQENIAPISNGYSAQMTVWQLVKSAPGGGGAAVYNIDPAANILTTKRGYQLHGCWPSNVSAIDLAYDSNDTVEEFTVELQVSWWEAASFGDGADAPEAPGTGGQVFSVN